jgi:LruC domain-containing protein
VLANPVNMVGFQQPPYNPFLIVNLERGKEVHLANYPPSTLANTGYFGTENDDSNPAGGKYYKTASNLPWVMHIPAPFDYLKEKKPVINGHLVFKDWVFSSGSIYSDWYKNKPGYRNPNKIYLRIQK